MGDREQGVCEVAAERDRDGVAVFVYSTLLGSKANKQICREDVGWEEYAAMRREECS